MGCLHLRFMARIDPVVAPVEGSGMKNGMKS